MATTKSQRSNAGVLVDTFVWIEFIRFGNPQLLQLLNEGRVLMHDMVIGEIACGSAPNRSERLAVMDNLPKIDLAEHADVLNFIEIHQLFGCGVGYLGNHLMAAAVLPDKCRLWSRDKRLAGAAGQLGIAFESLAH